MDVVSVQTVENGEIIKYLNKGNIKLKVKDSVVVKTSRGIELGIVKKIQDEAGFEQNASIMRKATKADLKHYEQNKQKAKDEFKNVQELIYQSGLKNKLCNLEFLLDNKKMVITFVSDVLVEFRPLIKLLSPKYKMKIEIKIIGARDEIKIKGAIGMCGQECCCSRFIKNFEKVSLKMAKNQNISLSPSKINGPCGKLLCCFAYENSFYEEAKKDMPKVNSKVKTPSGEGVVVYNDLCNKRCIVKEEISEGKFVKKEYEVSEIEFTKE